MSLEDWLGLSGLLAFQRLSQESSVINLMTYCGRSPSRRQISRSVWCEWSHYIPGRSLESYPEASRSPHIQENALGPGECEILEGYATDAPIVLDPVFLGYDTNN